MVRLAFCCAANSTAAPKTIASISEPYGVNLFQDKTKFDVSERGEANPSTDILNRIAKALERSPDFLMNGTLEDKSAEALRDEELLLQFRKV